MELSPFLSTPLMYSEKALRVPPEQFQWGPRELPSLFCFQSTLQPVFPSHVPEHESDYTQGFDDCPPGMECKCPTQHANIYLASTYLPSIDLHSTLLPRTTYVCRNAPLPAPQAPALLLCPMTSCSLSLQYFSAYLLETQLKSHLFQNVSKSPHCDQSFLLSLINAQCPTPLWTESCMNL